MTLMMYGCFPETVNQFPICFNANLTIKEFHYLNKMLNKIQVFE